MAFFTKAEEWGYWPEGRRNPMSPVKIGEKWSKRPERILTEEETVKVLPRLSDPNLLILETAIATGARISELLGLKWCYVDLQSWHPPYCAAQLARRHRRSEVQDQQAPSHVGIPGRPLPPEGRRGQGATGRRGSSSERTAAASHLWDSGVRQALKRAAAAEGCDFPGLGPALLPSAPTSRGGRRWVGRALRRRRSPATARSG